MNAWPHTTAARRIGTRLALLLGLGAATACFIEDPLGLDGDDTNGPACTDGEIGCACTADGSCGESLSCLAEENVCIPSGCAPASAFCTCDDGACDGELSCNGGICIPPSNDDAVMDDDTDTGDDGSTTGSQGTDGATDESTGTDAGASDTSGESGNGDTHGSSDDAATTDADTGPGMVCTEEPSCSECFLCASEPFQGCEAEGQACQEIGGCPVVAQCLQGCSADGLCLDDCCATATNAAVTAAHVLDDCRRDACATTCGDFNDAPCSS